MDVKSLNSVAQGASKPATTTGAGAGAGKDSGAELSKTFNNFLTLLTTQLKNQDPLKPMDSSEFTQQLVSFSGVEQQINTNTKLEDILKIQRSAELLGASSYLGKQVEVEGSAFTLEDGGTAKFAYALEKVADKATATILDSNGQIVKTIQVDKATGRHEVTWDGKNASGSTAKPGNYTVVVNALDDKGAPLAAVTSVHGKVTDLHTSKDDGTLLTVGGANVKLDKILSVSNSSTSNT